MSEQTKKDRARPASRRVLRLAAWGTGGILAAVLCLVLAALAALQTPWARRFLADQAAAYCSRELGWTLSMTPPEGALPLRIRVASLSLADGQGTWLEVADAAVTVTPWPFAKGYGEVAVEAGKVALARAPLSPSGRATPPPEPSRPLAFLDGLSPLPVEAGASVRIGELRLGQGLTGLTGEGRDLAGEVRLDAQAVGGVAQAKLRTVLAGVPADRSLVEGAQASSGNPPDGGPRSEIGLDARFDPGARSASLSLSLVEQPGGLTATLAGLPATVPFAVKLSGSGPFSDFKMDLSAASGQREVLSGTLTASLGRTSSDDAQALLALILDPSVLPLDEQAHKALGSRATLDFSGVFTSRDLPAPQWRVLVKNLAVGAAAGKVSLTGDTGPEGLAPRLSFTASMTDPAAVGSPTGPVAVEGSLKADVDPAGPFTASVSVASGDLGSALAPFGLGLSGKARIAADLSGDSAVKDFKGSLDVALSELAGTGQPGTEQAGKNQAGKSSGASVGDLGQALARALGSTAALSLSGSLAGDKATLSALSLKSSAATVDASGSFDQAGQAFVLSARVEAPDLGRLSSLAGMKLKGSATVRAEGQGTLSSPKGSVTVEGRKLELDSTALDAATASLTAAPAGDGFSGALQVQALRGKAALRVVTAYALAGQRLGLTGLTAAGPGLDLSGGLDLSLAHKTASGRLKLAADLSGLGGFLGMKMAGRASADAALASDGPRQDVTLKLDATGLSVRDVAVGKADVAASLTDVLRAPKGAATVKASGVRTGGTTVESLALSAKGGGDSVAFDLSAKGGLPEPFDAALAGTFAPENGGGRLALSRLEAGAYTVRLSLKKPVQASFGQGRARLDGLDLTVGGGSLTASGVMSQGRTEFTADLKGLPLAALAGVGAPPLTGAASASVSVSGPSARPKVDASLDLTDVKSQALSRAQDPAKVPAATMTVRAGLSGGRLDASCRASAGPDVAFTLKAGLPAKFSLEPFSFDLPPNAALDASLNGGVDLAAIPPMLGDDALNLTGVLKADFTATGKLSSPTVSGRAFLEGGQAQYVTTGTMLKDIALDLTASGDEVVLKRFSARDAKGGSLMAQGSASLAQDKGFPFRAALAADKLTPVRMDMVTAQLTAAVDASGDAAGATVKGGVNVGPVEVAIPDSLPPDATPIQVVMLDKPGARPPAHHTDSKPYPVNLDLTIDFPGRIFVRGMGLDSMWAGHLGVKGRADEPVVDGSIRIVRGQLDFFGKNFNLARGEVTFHGTNPPVPMLDIDAQAQASDITASILVTGEATRPVIDFTSDPAVPRDEILARVLFGQSVSSLTPPQALQLAQAVATLSGAGTSLDFLGKTRKLAGLDYLGVKSSGQSLGSSSVAAGKYLADGVYVEASQGLGAKSGAVSVEVDVTKNITVDSKVGLDAKTGAGVNWKFDY